MSAALVIVGLASFLAGVVNAAFSTGGVFVMVAATTAVFPMTVAVPLQGVLSAGSVLMRIWLFRQHLCWPLILLFVPGGAIGTYFGVQVFVTLDEGMIATFMGLVLLGILWLPPASFRLPIGRPFAAIGLAHGFLGSLFGVGAVLQPMILWTDLKKLQITGTMAMCLFSLDLLKTAGYIAVGFDYGAYLPHIAIATVMGMAGVVIGKRLSHLVSEAQFRFILRWLITLVALRLVGVGLFAIVFVE
jgi:uncharacterized protein